MATRTSKYIPPQSTKDLVLAWIRRVRESQFAHYEQSSVLNKFNRWLGIPVIIITTVVGTTVFVSLSEQTSSLEIKIILGLMSVIAAVLSSLQTFLKYSEKAEQHRTTAARYGSIRRKLEQVYADINNENLNPQILDKLREEIDTLAEESPEVSAKIFQKIQQNIFFVGESNNDVENG